MPRTAALAGLVLGASILLAACSSGTASTSAPGTTAASAAPPATTAPSTAASAGATTKVNANTASQAELAAAFTAAGISNADRWAREVTEYRPYPSDPSWAQLRQELGKYNIDPAVLEQIIAILEV
jgi:DNA uptake protein ComE-like DNA-binding protein